MFKKNSDILYLYLSFVKGVKVHEKDSQNLTLKLFTFFFFSLSMQGKNQKFISCIREVNPFEGIP
ncbi:hypothetical protein BpHYR1_003762 [Brachionus plicatilis]|uniref:Uncharacterized protein n=1 Tax=Brachionus plicatilis TaxID=10195 RepID=A0A3M7SPA7_BRAPC|nr:hypothetical protein BpHYR1_003762 [Brachionus plicatilis]